MNSLTDTTGLREDLRERDFAASDELLRDDVRTLGALVKYREDADRVRDALDHLLAP